MLEKDRYLSEGDVARILSLSTETLRKWRHRRVGPPWVKIEGSVRYAEEKLKRFLERNSSDGL